MILVRQESWEDYKDIEAMLLRADPSEKLALRANQFRTSEVFIPDLTLVATLDWRITAYMMLFRAFVESGNGKFEAPAVAIFAEDPAFSVEGAKSKLMQKAKEQVVRKGYSLMLALGDERQYQKYKFKKQKRIALGLADRDLPLMVCELTDGALDAVKGRVEFPDFVFA